MHNIFLHSSTNHSNLISSSSSIFFFCSFSCYFPLFDVNYFQCLPKALVYMTSTTQRQLQFTTAALLLFFFNDPVCLYTKNGLWVYFQIIILMDCNGKILPENVWRKVDEEKTTGKQVNEITKQRIHVKHDKKYIYIEWFFIQQAI